MSTSPAASPLMAFFDQSSASAQQMFSSTRIPGWKAIPVFIPHRVRRKWRATKSRIRSRQTPTSSLSALNTSFSPSDTIKSLRAHRWSYYDAQYIFLAILAIFCLSFMQSPGPLGKTLAMALLMGSLVIPATRQFFLPFLPIAGYLLLFFSCKFIPSDYRPPIWVRVLPTLENVLYGANLSNILSAHQHVLLDLLAWLPYGIGHFANPFICAVALFIWGPPKTLRVYACAFGYLNIAAVTINLIFPCSPPWYENMYGLAPATYQVKGSAAGLERIDKLLGIDLYTSAFKGSPQVFGAFPSMHAGDATIEALFLGHVFPQLFPVFIAYVLWLWWATMYLSHHYAVDLAAGSLMSCVIFYIARTKFLPRLQQDKEFRWDYDYIEIGEADPHGSGSHGGYGMIDFYDELHGHSDSDSWTIGSSSSYSSGGRSPSNGTRSPTEESRSSLWDGDTLASHSDHESR